MGNIAIHTINPLLLDQNSWTQTLPNERASRADGATVKRCSSNECTNGAVKGGVCIKHGAKRKLCSCDGCTNYAKKEGLCQRHGAYVKR